MSVTFVAEMRVTSRKHGGGTLTSSHDKHSFKKKKKNEIGRQ